MPFVFMGLGAAALVRGIFRPHRAVVREGTVSRCGGPNQFRVCDPTDTIQAPAGTPVYAVAPGKIVAVGEDFLHIVTSNDDAILMYEGLTPNVVEGQFVGRGQKLGDTSGPLNFGVWQFAPSATGAVLQQVPAGAWLAARGARHASKNTGAEDKWCEGGRVIHVPKATADSCKFRQPDAARFALLPVQIDMGME